MSKALFVSNQNYLLPTGGGVQWCTQDYLKTLAAAGLEVHPVAYDNDRSLASRVRRKFAPQPCRNLVPANLVAQIEAARAATGAQWIFLNNSEPLERIGQIKAATQGRARLIYLSHGVESTDQINALKIDATTVPAERRKPEWIGQLLLAELEQRRSLDGVVCISEEDTLFERWLGSEQVGFLPRTISLEPLNWCPVVGRVGTVSTLNHLPNLDGIRRLAAELDRQTEVRLRVVGQPTAAGEQLARDFRCVDYVGALDDNAFKEEAATWRAFVNPIFCQARGASTKVAKALGWGLPVVTTVQGARGYRWDDSLLPRLTQPKEMATLARSIALAGDGQTWQQAAIKIRELAPTFAGAGELLNRFLAGL